ncbi:zinc ribbon domain-containing protein [Pseudobutyrivibrio sp.]|uniref:zinc ribbon domain-containing protein n=1 Tax=Pseudobutyrivibrio sp. TaxID=2014367 RepID=UPI0038651944
MFCNNCGTQLEEGAAFCPNCGGSVGVAPAPQLGLKWAHFLSYFALWLGALLNVIVAFTVFTGSLYSAQGIEAEYVYAVLPGLKPIDMIYGVALLVLAVLGVITAVSIIKYKKNAGTLVCAMYLVSAIVAFIYLVGASSVLGQFAGNSSSVASIIVGIVMFFVNKIYFGNRKDIFVN